MDSSSQSLYVLRSPPLQQDDLAYRSIGAYVQDTWIVDEANELALVLRLDDIETRWTDMKRELHRTVVAPRFFYKHTHNEWLTSRASAGLGYRSPLTLFESQHGTDHNGFVIDIRDLETAQSLTYSLAGQRLDDFFELSTHITRIENMAYGVDRVGLDSPTLFRSSEDPYTVSVIDASYGRRITHSWTLEGLYEHFFYERGYKAKLPVAAIEQRLSLLSNVSWGKWTASQRVSMIGSRDLSAYGYDRHYNVAFTDPDIYSPTVGETFVSERKKQKAPAFFTLDLTFERSLGANLSLGFSVLNVFDYTQTRAGDSPLTWELHGDHYHLDNFHIWGPLRGRQVFLTLKGTI